MLQSSRPPEGTAPPRRRTTEGGRFRSALRLKEIEMPVSNNGSDKKKDSNQGNVSRREFLTRAAATIALPTILPSGVLAAPGQPGANDRLVIGYIGVGGMGSGHVREDDS